MGFPESGELLLVEFPLLEPVEEGEAEGEEEEKPDVADEPLEDVSQGSDHDQPESEDDDEDEDEGLDESDEDPATPAVLEPCGIHSELMMAAALRPSLSPDVAWWW